MRATRERLVEDAAQSIQVTPPVDGCVAASLLRAHVGRRSHHQTFACDSRIRPPARRGWLSTRPTNQSRDAKIRQHGVSRLEENVLGLDVAVDHTATMRVV